MAIGHAAKPVRQDRISKLDDVLLGHVLSFLPSKQAARAAVLSSRWRDAFAGVHTVCLLEEPKDSVPEHNLPSPVGAAITAAIVARHRKPAATPPLRALRVALQYYRYHDSVAVDQWVSYALKQAGPELEIDLRLRSLPIYCSRDDDADTSEEQDSTDEDDDDDDNDSDGDGGDKDSSEYDSSEDERVPDPSPLLMCTEESFLLYTVPRGLFSCSTLRTLRIGPCRLSPPSAVTLPSLQELFLTRVSDAGEAVQGLISGCRRLADLTLESCDTVTALSLFDTPLRRLVLRCCHSLSSVALDVSELGAFEYRGAVPEIPFLATLGARGWFLSMPSLASCTVYICGGEVTAPEELARLTAFLQHFASAKHLRLRSKRMYLDIGSRDGVTSLPAFRNLHHLELWGHLPHDGDGAAIVGATGRILRQAPNLEVLSLVFEPGTGPDVDDDDGPLPTGRFRCKATELQAAHRLKYDAHSVLAWPSGGTMIPCLRNRVREINLVHYQGGRAQRTLAKFLLRNAPVMDELWCQFAAGPSWKQTELMREMKCWVMNEKANTVFR